MNVAPEGLIGFEYLANFRVIVRYAVPSPATGNSLRGVSVHGIPANPAVAWCRSRASHQVTTQDPRPTFEKEHS